MLCLEELRKEHHLIIGAIYARYSTEMQNSATIETQIQKCKDYTDKNGIVVPDEYILFDEARSGQTDERENLDVIKNLVNEGKIHVLLVYDYSRLFRNFGLLVSWFVALEDKGVLLLNALMGYEPYGIVGKMMFAIEAINGEEYVIRQSKVVLDGQLTNAKKCRSNGGIPPLGYDLDENKKYIINAHEAVAVRFIFEHYLQEWTYGEIIQWLNTHGYHTKQGNSFGKNSIYEILKNEKYTGTYIFNKSAHKRVNCAHRHRYKRAEEIVRITHAFTPIISEELFQSTQKRLATRKRGGQKKAIEKYLLSGKLKCQCGSAYVGNRRRGNDREKIYVSYRCSRKSNSANFRCHNRDINRDFLENQVIDFLKVYLSEKTSIDQLIAEYESYCQEKAINLDTQRKALHRKINQQKRSIHNVLEAVKRTGSASFDEELKKMESQLVMWEAEEIELKEAKRKSKPNCKEMAQAFQAALKKLKKADFAIRRSLVEQFIDQIVVYEDRVQVMFNFYPDDKQLSLNALPSDLDKKSHAQKLCMTMAEKEGFEPSRRYKRPTP